MSADEDTALDEPEPENRRQQDRKYDQDERSVNPSKPEADIQPWTYDYKNGHWWSG